MKCKQINNKANSQLQTCYSVYSSTLAPEGVAVSGNTRGRFGRGFGNSSCLFGLCTQGLYLSDSLSNGNMDLCNSAYNIS